MENILKRRSIRKYKNDKINDELIKKILIAGMSAPSAGDEQAWQFIVINDDELIKRIPKVHPYSFFIENAPLAILVCGDLSLEKHKGFWVQDVSAATENILIAATSLGLGSIWLGVYPRDDRVKGLQKMFNLPEHVIPFSLIPVGYAAEEKPKKDAYYKEKVHFNEWNNIEE